jgi:hypothetical protein
MDYHFCDLTYSGCKHNRLNGYHPIRNPPGKTHPLNVTIYNPDTRFCHLKTRADIHMCESCRGIVKKFIMADYVCGMGICESSLHDKSLRNACMVFSKKDEKKRCEHCLSQLVK